MKAKPVSVFRKLLFVLAALSAGLMLARPAGAALITYTIGGIFDATHANGDPVLNGPFGLETGDAVSAQLTIDHSLTDGTFSIDALKGIDSGTSLKFFMGTAVYTEMEELGFGFGWPTVTLANGRWIDADYQGNLADGGTIYRLGVLHNGQPGFDWTIIDVTADPTGPAPSAVSDAAGVFEFQIPEPASLVLLIGALGLFGLRRRVMRRACIS